MSNDVQKQYEDFPYPTRPPEDEKKRLIATRLDGLDRINHYCFAGKKDFSKNFRVLIAGCGTGDATIFLAEQLRGTNAEIFSLDISSASLGIAQKRAEIRGLKNINWINDSLLNIPKLGLGKFDYINCSGVLHHLTDTDAGLSTLKNSLKTDGAMGIMLYAPYGRTGVYHIQKLLRTYNKNEQSNITRLENCKKLLRQVPSNSWFAAMASTFKTEFEFGDAGIYDLFLHSQDRAFSIEELYEYTGKAELKIIKLFGTASTIGNKTYEPESYIKDEEILTKVKDLDKVSQMSIAEMMNGGITQHLFYAMNKDSLKPEADINDPDNIPFLSISNNAGTYAHLYDLVCRSGSEVNLNRTIDGNPVTVNFKKTSNTELLLKNFDGKRSTRAIIDGVKGDVFVGFQSLFEEFRHIYLAFNNFNWMFLRSSETAVFKSIEELQETSMGKNTW